MIRAFAFALLVLTGMISPVLAQAVPTPEKIEVVDGKATIKGRIVGKELASYAFSAKAGDPVTINLTAPTPSANFNVLPLGQEAAIYIGSINGPEFAGTLPPDGDYEIRVYLMGQAAETGSANFTLEVTLGGAEAKPADFADSDAGGPDFWKVAGLSAGGSLNVRTEPSSSADVALKISSGTVLRNLGCRTIDGTRWCQVESPDGVTIKGWVAGRYLVESGPPPEGDAKVAGTPYNATGELACTLAAFPGTTTCPFGVIRAPTGLASIFIKLPDGGERLLEFRNGSPVAPPGMQMTSTRDGDTTIVNLDGGAEVYSVVDVVHQGD